MVLQLAESILGQLEYALSLLRSTVNYDDICRLAEAQSNYCMLLQSAFGRLQQSSCAIADRAMSVFLSILNSSICTQATSLHEDVLMAIESLLLEIGGDKFSSYFPYFYPKLMAVVGKRLSADQPAPQRVSEVTKVAIGIIGELSRSMPKESLSGCVNEFISALLDCIRVFTYF